MSSSSRTSAPLLLALSAAAAAAAAAAAPTTGFLTRNGSSLVAPGGGSFRAGGVNAYWLGLDENEGGVHYPTHFRVTDGLAAIAGFLGPTLVRAHTVGISTGCPLSFEPRLGVFNASALDAADWAIAEAERLGLRLIVPLTDNYAYFHGGKRKKRMEKEGRGERRDRERRNPTPLADTALLPHPRDVPAERARAAFPTSRRQASTTLPTG